MKSSCSHCVVLAVLGALACTGCGPEAGSLLYYFDPGKKVEPRFVLTKGPLLVMLEDRDGWLSNPQARDELLAEIERQFRQHNVNTRLIDPTRLRRLKAESPDFESMSVSRVGRELGAEQVLYLFVEKFNLRSPDAGEGAQPVYKGDYAVNVRVVNARPDDPRDPSEVSLWPGTPGKGETFEVVEPLAVSEEAGFADELSKKLAGRLGRKVARCFYEYRITPDSRIEED